MIYTVDEVSDLLSIPRPTLYRYLREYSIPHVRRAGKISIPEDSFDRIREARELHREGLGTESVRRRLREGNDLDAEELVERLDQLSEGLEGLQGLRSSGEDSSSQETLQTILERQDSLISAVSDLREMVQNLMTAESRLGRSRRSTLERDRERYYSGAAFLARPEKFSEVAAGAKKESNVYSYASGAATDEFTAGRSASAPATLVAEEDPTVRLYPEPDDPPATTGRFEGFGAHSHRRRRTVLLLALIMGGAVLAWSLLASGEEEIEEPVLEEPVSEEQYAESAPPASEASQAVAAPDLAGLSLSQAEEKLGEAGLRLGTLSEMPTYEIPAGEVVGQGLQAGAEVEPGTAVDVMVSAAPLEYTPGVQSAESVVGPAVEQNPAGVPQYPVGAVQSPDVVAQPDPFGTPAPVGAAPVG